MPTQLPSDRSDRPGPGSDPAHGAGQPAPGVARRSVLRGAAGLGAVGLAAAAGVGAVAAATRPANAAPSPAPRAAAAGTAAQASDAGPLVVYLRDAAAGEFEVFRGTQQVKVRNPRLVAQLLDGIATAQ
jgi:hypothetical protein